MRIDQLALLFALAVAANLVLLVALELPRIGSRSRQLAGGPDVGHRANVLGGGAVGGHADGPAANDPQLAGGQAGTLPSALYQRVTRIVSVLFIGSVLVASLVGGAIEPILLGLLVGGLFVVVLFQDVLPAGTLGRWRLAFEALLATAFVTSLVYLTGGVESPYYFGYILLVGGTAVLASGTGPALLTIIASAAYLAAVGFASSGALALDQLAQVAFNLVTLALITFVGAVVGREQRAAREDALRLSRFDSMTGLYSRDYFISAVDQEILRAARSGRPFAILLIDLDGLKAANDRFGHASGDVLLRAVSDVIRGDIRVTDVAARYGGDEFVLLLPETDLAGAMRVAGKVRVDIARLTLPHDGAVIRTSASIGLVTYPEDGRTSAELIRRADLAMYEAKRRGRDQVVRFARQVSVPMVAASGRRASSAAMGDRRSSTAPMGDRRSSTAPMGDRRASRPSVPPPSAGPAPWERVR